MLLFSLLSLYMFLCGLVFFNQRSLIYHPTSYVPAESSKISSFQSAGETLQLSVRATDGDKAIIYFGGNAETVAQSLEKYALAFPEYAIYMLHYRGFSGSSGKPSEAALHEDAGKLYEIVSSKHGKITIIGRSLGSGVAIRLAATKPVEKLILITPYDSLLSLAKQRFPFLPVEWMLKDRFESWRYASNVSAPTVILAADSDQVIPLANTKALYNRFQPDVAMLKVIKKADHVSISTKLEYFPLMQNN